MRAMSVLPNADGSAVFEAGNTGSGGGTALARRPCAPTRSTTARSRCEFSMASFSTGERRRRTKGDRKSVDEPRDQQALEAAVLTELMPRSQLDVNIQVLQADGGVRAAAINAAVLALADAGVPLRDTMAACSAGYLDGTPLLDVNYAEEGGGGPEVHVAAQPNLEKVVLLQMDNKCAMDVFELIHQLALEGCKVVAGVMRDAMLKRTRALAAARANEAL